MATGPLIFDVFVAFILAACLLFHYGNWYRHHIIVTLAVLIAWYFSFLTILVIPLDVSSAVYRQCLEQNEAVPVAPSRIDNTTSNSTPVSAGCVQPWSHVPENTFPNLWRIVYWTSQLLTWIIMPLMQSYTQAGEFSVRGKLKSALVDNAIYYGSYLFIAGILLIYIAVKPGLDLDSQKLKAIASSASNTWGLFLLVLLLGYALVDIPRSLWNHSKRGYSLEYSYFKVSKLRHEKCEAEEAVDDVLDSLQIIVNSITPNHPMYKNLEIILNKIPVELKEKMSKRTMESQPTFGCTEKTLIRLHKQVIKCLQTLHRTEAQWNIIVDKVYLLEDIARNEGSIERRFKSSSPPRNSYMSRILCHPVIEWYYRCMIYRITLKVLSVVTALFSFIVVWSEVTFFNKEPVLSLFAVLLNLTLDDYSTMELLSTLFISYLCYCAYSTVLQIKFLNKYYIAGHHQTDEFSLIFSGMMLCRLTPPLCLNFLGLIHMDSHVIKSQIMESYYTQIMGHMDVISIVSDGFNVYFPMLMLLLCVATYFSLGSRFLSFLGFQQFFGDDELTTDLVEEGKELIKREKSRKQRVEDSERRKREFQQFTNRNEQSRARSRNVDQDRFRQNVRDDSSDSGRTGLLHDVEHLEYYVEPSENRHTVEDRDRSGRLPKSFFDDV